LRVAQSTSDPVVKNELLAAAAWLHDEAIKIEKLLTSPRGGGGGPQPPVRSKADRERAPRPPRSLPRYHRPPTGDQRQPPSLPA